MPKKEPVPVFQDNSIILQSVRSCQQVFSAAMIAYLETNYSDIEDKNKLAQPIPNPSEDVDFLRCQLADWKNQRNWFADKKLRNWIEHSRLHPSSHLINMRKKSRLPHQEKKLFPAKSSKDRIEARARARAIENIERLL